MKQMSVLHNFFFPYSRNGFISDVDLDGLVIVFFFFILN